MGGLKTDSRGTGGAAQLGGGKLGRREMESKQVTAIIAAGCSSATGYTDKQPLCRQCLQINDGALLTSLGGGHNYYFCPRKFRPWVHPQFLSAYTLQLQSDFSKFQNSTSNHVLAVSSVLYQRDLDSVREVIPKFSLLRTWSSASLRNWSHLPVAQTCSWTESTPPLFPSPPHSIPPRIDQFTC